MILFCMHGGLRIISSGELGVHHLGLGVHHQGGYCTLSDIGMGSYAENGIISHSRSPMSALTSQTIPSLPCYFITGI